ncbi:MAG: flagellar hook-associated protein FlgK [Alphaproteobacteria bacterium]|nr:flagellar hook-associated protein FlgK [Alphaproteobacteria bacterium]
MSFSAIRTIATSAMMASQVQIQVTSSNIANADTEGYSRKIATQIATVTGSVSSGTAITAIASNVDKYLLRDLVAATSIQSAATISESFANSLQSLFGNVSTDEDGSTSIAATIADMESALSSLSGTPESDILANVALESIETLATQLRETSGLIQGLREDADGQIADTVTNINEALETIDSLNDQIVTATARKLSTADLEDQRNQALQTLAEAIDVSYCVSSDGTMRIATSSGTVLLDSKVHALSYDPAAIVTADTVFEAITVDGKDITGTLSGGTIGALLEQRDDVLPEVQDELDSLATGLIDALNVAYNAGTTLPAPDSLTGTTSINPSDSLSATGTTRIALVDDGGGLVSYADFDLSAYTTIGDLVGAIDATTGFDASVTDGVLTIASTGGSGIAIAGIDAEIGSDSAGFSAFFGLNDLLTGTGAADIAVAESVASNGLSTATLSAAASLTAGTQVVSYSQDFVRSLTDALSEDQSFAAAGALGATSTSLAEYAAKIVADVASRASGAETGLETAQSAYGSLSDAFLSETGVNIDEETANLTEYQQLYSASAQLFEVLNAMFDALLSAAQSA